MADAVAPGLHWLLPLAGQRLLVIDPGSRWCKLLVVEALFGRTSVVHRQTIDLQEEGLLAAEEIHEHLQTLMPQLGPHDVALVLPQHRVINQLVELPATTAQDLPKTIEGEVARLSGLAEGSLLHDFAPLKPFGRYQNPHWIILSQADEVWSQIQQFTGTEEGANPEAGAAALLEIAPAGQALFAASQAVLPLPSHAVLVDLGANNTVVAIRAHGQGVFATSFPLGGNQFTEVLAKCRGCGVDEAELLKRSTNLLTGPGAVPEFAAVLQDWQTQLRRTVTEWIEDNPEAELSLAGLPVFVCGGGAAQEGLFEFLNRWGQLRFEPWPADPEGEGDWPMTQYWVAYGVARQALGRTAARVSLLPTGLRAHRTRRRFWQRVQLTNALLLLTVAVVLAVGTWQKARLCHRKEALAAKTRNALEVAHTVELLSRRLSAEYDQIRPVLQRQRETMETLRTLAALQEVRGNKDFWYLLFADPVSYFAGTTLPLPATNQAPLTTSLFPTNSLPAGREFVAELCSPAEGEDARGVFSQVVEDLKREPLFAKVDALPPERKQNLVDPRVSITNHWFAIAIELARDDLPANPTHSGQPLPTPRERKRGTAGARPRPGSAPASPGATNR